jgi:hypothetical protein
VIRLLGHNKLYVKKKISFYKINSRINPVLLDPLMKGNFGVLAVMAAQRSLRIISRPFYFWKLDKSSRRVMTVDVTFAAGIDAPRAAPPVLSNAQRLEEF